MRALETPINLDWEDRLNRRLHDLAADVYEGVVGPYFAQGRTGPLEVEYRCAEKRAHEMSECAKNNAERLADVLTPERLEALEEKRLATLGHIISRAQN